MALENFGEKSGGKISQAIQKIRIHIGYILEPCLASEPYVKQPPSFEAMSSESNPSEEDNSCITARSSDLSVGPVNLPLPSRSSSFLSGYLADLESGGEDSNFGDDVVSNNSVNGPVGIILVPAIRSGNVEQLCQSDVNLQHENVGDSDDRNGGRNVQLLMEGDDSSSAPAISKEAEEKEDEQVANLRRKRTEAESLDGKKRKL